MDGRTGWRAIAAACVASASMLAACQSSDVQSLPPEDEAVGDSTTSSSSSTTTETTVSSTAETTLSDLAQAEAAIEAAIIGWWTFPTDSSLGDEGEAFDYVTGPLAQRLRDSNEQLAADGQVLRSRGNQRVRVLSIQVDLQGGTAEADVCTLGDGEIVDVDSGEVLAADLPTAYTGEAFAELVGDEWKVRDFFTSQQGSDPEECDVDGAS